MVATNMPIVAQGAKDCCHLQTDFFAEGVARHKPAKNHFERSLTAGRAPTLDHPQTSASTVWAAQRRVILFPSQMMPVTPSLSNQSVGSKISTPPILTGGVRCTCQVYGGVFRGGRKTNPLIEGSENVTNSRLMINSHLDYLTVSFKRVDKPEELIPQAYYLFRTVEDTPPLPNYDHGWKLACGGFVNLSDDDVQGARIDLPGQALAALRENGMVEERLIDILKMTKKIKRYTRADYCFNVMGGGSVRHLLAHYNAGNVETRFKESPVIKYGTPDKRGGISPYGATLEFGKETSEHRVAIYDKAADLKLLDQAWLRVEMRTRKPVSSVFMHDGKKFTLQRAARARLEKLLNYPKLAWWREMMEGDNCPVGIVPRKPDKYEWWMDNQVFNAGKNRRQDEAKREWMLEWAGRFVSMLLDDEANDERTSEYRYAGND
jgi:hypothetical protein